MNPIYLSTGAFTGRINGRDPRLLSEYHSLFHCDGFELMLFADFYACISDVLPLYRGIPIPVVHSDKEIGDFLSTPGEEAFLAARSLMRKNLSVCEVVGATRMVLHGWGKPDSDSQPERTADRVLRLWEEARERGVEILCENCVCVNGDPLSMFEKLLQRDGRLRFVFDTRPAQFHAQLRESLASDVFLRSAAHLHINDYAGGYKQWDALYPIPQPGKGNIDWGMFFDGIRAARYAGSVTLEAPSMLAKGVDAETLNRSLDYLRGELRP